MFKKSLLVIALIILSVSNSYSATKMKKYQNPEKVWVNHCKSNDCFGYCENVGKKAVNYPRIFDNELGTIIGVCWRPKGTLIGISEAIPSVGIPEEIRIAPENSFYYIIFDGYYKPFLRRCREISAK